ASWVLRGDDVVKRHLPSFGNEREARADVPRLRCAEGRPSADAGLRKQVEEGVLAAVFKAAFPPVAILVEQIRIVYLVIPGTIADEFKRDAQRDRVRCAFCLIDRHAHIWSSPGWFVF